ncbi:MAG: hypothetical protein ACK4IT_04290 [Thioalkalivibrionaceae bacterium]
MEPVQNSLKRFLGAHPQLNAPHPTVISAPDRLLIDDMLIAALGLEKQPDPTAEGAGGSRCDQLPPQANQPPRLRWWIRERMLVVMLHDKSTFSIARFLVRELRRQLATLGHPGGAENVRFLYDAPHRDAPTHRGSLEPPESVIERRLSPAGARDLATIASSIDDASLSAALRQLAKRLAPPETSPSPEQAHGITASRRSTAVRD